MSLDDAITWRDLLHETMGVVIFSVISTVFFICMNAYKKYKEQ